jgi:hypothetical protein
MTVINPTDEFLRYAADCERMAKVTRDPASKATWKRMAHRWLQCALNDRNTQPWERRTKCHYGRIPILVALISNRTLNQPL